jgi:cyclin-dependent kinase regulatory subunit CKS1
MSTAAASRVDYFTMTDPAQREQARQLIQRSQPKILYSEKYEDDEFEYRHVILPKDLSKLVPRTRLMDESEWRQIGVQQSVGWRHYMIHRPEPHILLFKRPKTTA